MPGEAPPVQQMGRELYEAGVFGMSIGFPTVPRGKARPRVMISAAHEKDDLNQGLEEFAAVGRKLGVIGYASINFTLHIRTQSPGASLKG